jgi:single-stranded DNA-binding protein
MNDTMLTVVGNVVDPPHRRSLDNGASVTTFRVASTSRRFDREQNAYVDRDTLFVRVNCWRQLGDNVVRSLVKGDPVVVTGRYFRSRSRSAPPTTWRPTRSVTTWRGARRSTRPPGRPVTRTRPTRSTNRSPTASRRRSRPRWDDGSGMPAGGEVLRHWYGHPFS